jgi:purine-binding chemotaxis protein CheW
VSAGEAFDVTEPRNDADGPPRPEPDRVSYLGFFLGSEIYGLPLHQLREVARVSHLRRVPGAPAGVAGLVNLRGEIVCALDVRAILALDVDGSPADHDRPAGRTAPGDSQFLIALRGFADPIGLIVDSIADIYLVSSHDIEPLPAEWPAGRAACCVGATRLPVGLMGLLDLAQVVKV